MVSAATPPESRAQQLNSILKGCQRVITTLTLSPPFLEDLQDFQLKDAQKFELRILAMVVRLQNLIVQTFQQFGVFFEEDGHVH